MKNIICQSKIHLIRKLLFLSILSLVWSSCLDEDQNFYTVTDDVAYTFLKKDTTYSEFVRVLNKSGLNGMLSAYGKYTCLAPNNEAFRNYYKSLGRNFSLDSLSTTDIQYLARTHIIGSVYLTTDMENGVIQAPNMNDRLIEVKFQAEQTDGNLKIMLNDSSQIMSKDNKVRNGVVHGISRILKPSEAQLPELIASNPQLSIFSDALKLTTLADSLRSIKDYNYVPVEGYKDEYDEYPIPSPASRKYGYTILAENNYIYNRYGIFNIDDLIRKANQLYPTDKQYENDYSNPNNSLNKYVSYHILRRSIPLNRFLYYSHSVPSAPVYEFYESMLKHRIMKITTVGLGDSRLVINPNTDYQARIRDTGGASTLNGVYHLLDNMLVYSDNVENMMQNTRIRFDVNSLFDELASNNLRCSNVMNMGGGDRYGIPQGYFKNLTSSKDTRLIYLAGEEKSSWTSYLGDELMGLGAYDMTIRLLPVPPGTYELRYGYSANGLRSVTQIYVDGRPVGIPLDLRIPASDARIGWQEDKETEDGGYENDKMMRNRGYMKAPTSFCVYFGAQPTLARDNKAALRRIVGTFTFTEYKEHYIRLKSVIDNNKAQLDVDFFEFVPKSIYNPASGEPESRD